MPKIRIDSRIEREFNEELEEFFGSEECPYATKSEFVRDCIYEGFSVVKKRVNYGETGRC